MTKNSPMPTPAQIADHQRSLKETVAGVERAKHATFAEDFERSAQCARAVEAYFLYIKHNLVPKTIEAGGHEVNLTMNNVHYSPWINDSAIHRKFADEAVVRALRKLLPAEYTIDAVVGNSLMYRISWT